MSWGEREERRDGEEASESERKREVTEAVLEQKQHSSRVAAALAQHSASSSEPLAGARRARGPSIKGLLCVPAAAARACVLRGSRRAAWLAACS